MYRPLQALNAALIFTCAMAGHVAGASPLAPDLSPGDELVYRVVHRRFVPDGPDRLEDEIVIGGTISLRMAGASAGGAATFEAGIMVTMIEGKGWEEGKAGPPISATFEVVVREDGALLPPEPTGVADEKQRYVAMNGPAGLLTGALLACLPVLPPDVDIRESPRPVRWSYDKVWGLLEMEYVSEPREDRTYIFGASETPSYTLVKPGTRPDIQDMSIVLQLRDGVVIDGRISSPLISGQDSSIIHRDTVDVVLIEDNRKAQSH